MQSVEQIEAKIQKLQAAIPRCEHRQIVGRCPYCDKCEHGVNAYSDCRKCHANDDRSWQSAEISRAEIVELERELRSYPDLAPWRNSPYRLRNFVVTPDQPDRLPLWGVLLRDYKKLLSERSSLLKT